MATPGDLIDAVTAGDTDRVRELLAEDPSLVASRDKEGVSALLLARYRFDRETTDALLAADPELDVFEAAALGYVDRLRERLLYSAEAVAAFSPDGFTALHLAAFFGKARSRGCSWNTGPRSTSTRATRSRTSPSTPPRPGGTSRSAGSSSRRART